MNINRLKLMVWLLAAFFFASAGVFCWMAIREMSESNDTALRRYRLELLTYGVLKETADGVKKEWRGQHDGSLPIPKPLDWGAEGGPK